MLNKGKTPGFISLLFAGTSESLLVSLLEAEA